MASRPAAQSRRGSGLVEVLVLASVLVVLAALLVPGLWRSRQRGYRAACMGHQRQIVSACVAYAHLWEDRLPHSNFDGNSDQRRWPGSSRLMAGWLYTEPFSVSRDQGQNLRNLRSGVCWQMLPQGDALFRCPIDLPPYDADLAGAPVRTLTSYVMNAAVNGYATAQPAYRLGQFNPAAIMLWEPDTLAPGYWHDGGHFPAEGLTARHGGANAPAASAPVTCFDGSSIWISRADFNAQTRRHPGLLWCDPATPDGGHR